MLDRNNHNVQKAVDLIVAACRAGHKLLLIGNGGSAVQADHTAGELLGRFKKERKALAAVSLTTASVVTAIGNDYGFENVFSRQIEGLGNEGDILLAHSTSGRSKNIIQAIKRAKEQGLKVISMVGEYTEAVKLYSDVVISIPSAETPKIQEEQLIISHQICEAIEEVLF